MASKAPVLSPLPEPLILIVPEGPRGGPDHWQTRWESRRDDCHRLELGMWDNPHRNTWINKLNLAIYRADRPVLLVGHGLGCMTIAWWAEYERPEAQGPVIGALLVAPPDPDQVQSDQRGQDPRLAKFASYPATALPFPALVVGSANDPACSMHRAMQLARDWDCRFADAGAVGHLDEASKVGDWAVGQHLLGRLLDDHHADCCERPILYPAAAKPRSSRPRLDS